MHDEHTIQVSLPLDSDGFLRRECPHCKQQFKWHFGPANEEAERQAPPSVYNCPLCGQPAPTDAWNTPVQVALIEEMAMAELHQLVNDELESIFRRQKGMTYRRARGGASYPADPLIEPDDMIIVAPPCHGFEPVKVPVNHLERLHCLVCGSAFSV